MIEDFKHFVSNKNLFSASERVLLAVSGGIDSVAMASLFSKAGFHFAIAHANFQLRGKESDRDEEFVKQLADDYKVEFFTRHFETTKYSRAEKISIQVAARQLRYKWFTELLANHGFNYIATAHHLDDQVETFLINLTRGTGIAGLHGIPPKQGKLIRPMLFAYRSGIENYAKENKLQFVEDSSNLWDKYLRNRIRHKIIPEMQKISPGFTTDLNQTISFIRDAETIYRQAVEEKRGEMLLSKGSEIYINSEKFFSLKPLASWAYELLSPYGFNQSNIADITRLANAIPGKEVRSDTFRLIKDRKYLIISPIPNNSIVQGVMISLDEIQQNRFRGPINLSFEILKKSPSSLASLVTTAYIDLDKLAFPLQIRKWQRGDYFFPLGMSHQKKLSDFFTDQKFSRIEKEQLWLLCSEREIVWIVGHRLDERFKVTPATERIVKIIFTPE